MRQRRRKVLTVVEVAKRIDHKLTSKIVEGIEEQARLDREFCDGLVDLMDRNQLFKEATVENRKALPGGGGHPRALAKSKAMVPTFDNVLVRRDEAADRSAGGILLPDTGKEKPKRGFVVAVGPGRWTKEGVWVVPPCKAGDTVFVRHWNGADVLINNEKHEIFNAAEIIGVETDDKETIEKAYGKGVA